MSRPPPQIPNCFRNLEAVITSVNDYASGLFCGSSWSWDTFKIIAPAGTLDHWQDISDQCFGASTLFVRGSISEGRKTSDHVCEELQGAIRSNTPGLLIKFWRMAWYLHKPHQFFGDLRILSGFWNYFCGLVHIFYQESHPVSRLLGALVQVWEEHLLNTLLVGYRRAIVSMEMYLGETHA